MVGSDAVGEGDGYELQEPAQGAGLDGVHEGRGEEHEENEAQDLEEGVHHERSLERGIADPREQRGQDVYAHGMLAEEAAHVPPWRKGGGDPARHGLPAIRAEICA